MIEIATNDFDAAKGGYHIAVGEALLALGDWRRESQLKNQPSCHR